jgi:hypothetical protein
MTEKPEEPAPTPAIPEKLLIDNPSDFQFHAAYIAYNNAFDKTSNIEIKKRLNENIQALQQKQIDFSTFYMNINQYRGEDSPQRGYGRTFITGQKKKDWRREAQKQERIKRHKK